MEAALELTLADALGLAARELVAFVGAGGKTSALLVLTDELAAAGRRVVATTTTAMFTTQLAAAGLVWAYEDGPTDALDAALESQGRAAIAGGSREGGKVAGLPGSEVDELWRSGLADYMLVEADGSRQLPFKAFGDHEPQVPSAATTIVEVAGLDVLGAPLSEDRVHRAAILASLLAIPPGSEVTTAVLAAGLRAQLAQLVRTHPAARLLVLLNKAESPESQAAGREVARSLLRDETARSRPELVVVASLRERRFAVETR